MNRILCFDIGGTGVKGRLFDCSGHPLSDRVRIPTPHPATPKAIFRVMDQISTAVNGSFQRISVGFPGIVKNGVTFNAPNLSSLWKGFPLLKSVERTFSVRAYVANDSDLQGLGASHGKGVELTITLGTGVGSALIYDGTLISNLELGHHPFRHGQTYEEQLGKEALQAIGPVRWNQRVHKMIHNFAVVFNYDALYLGGGNAKHVYRRLPSNVHLVSNESAMIGGVRLWCPDHKPARLRVSRNRTISESSSGFKVGP